MQKHKKENYFYKDNFEALLHDFENGKQMVFFLGAGINISGDNGMDWNSLLDSLFIEAITFLSIEKNFSVETQLTIDKAFEIPEFPKIKKQDDSVQGEAPQLKDDTKLELERHIQFKKEAEQWSKLHKLVKNEFTPLVKASIIKEILGDNYITSIQNYLYSKCNKEELKKVFQEDYDITKLTTYPPPGRYYSLYQLARLIILLPNVRAVVTYNFDNLLTEAIDILRKDKNRYFRPEESITKRIPKDISNSSNEELNEESFPIYHIHGYIPPPTEIYLDKKNEIVLSMEEFYDNFGNLLSWQTAGQLHFLSNYTCIFTGLSLSDITTQRMIHTAHEQNKSRRIYYLSAANLDKKGDENFCNAYLSLINIKNSFHANYGLSPIYEKNGYDKLFERFNSIIEKIVKNRNKKNKNE